MLLHRLSAACWQAQGARQGLVCCWDGNWVTTPIRCVFAHTLCNGWNTRGQRCVLFRSLCCSWGAPDRVHRGTDRISTLAQHFNLQGMPA